MKDELQKAAVEISEWPVMSLALATSKLLVLESVDADVDKLTAGLPVEGNNIPEELLNRATKRFGYQVIWKKSGAIRRLKFPCCLTLPNGHYLVIIGVDQGNVLILDSEQSSIYHKTPIEEFKGIGNFRWFQLRPSIRTLREKYEIINDISGHWFWNSIFRQKKQIVDIILATAVANTLAIMTSLFALHVYDRVIPGQSEATLWVLASGVGVAILIEAVLRVSRARLIDEMGREIDTSVSSNLFSRVLGLKMDNLPTSPNGLAHMMREFSTVREFFTTAAVGVAADIPFVVIFLLLIFGIAGNVIWVIMLGMVLILLPGILLRGKLVRLSKENIGGATAASRLLTEVAYGLEAIKVSRSESFFQRQWEDLSVLNANTTAEHRYLSAFLTFWATAIQQFTYIFAIIAGVYMIFEGKYTLGAIIAVGILSTRVLSPLTQFSQILSRWQNMKETLNALEKLVTSDQEIEINRSYFRRERFNGELSFLNVQFNYSGSKRQHVQIKSLNITAGQRVAILGANGSGKSTMLRLASGLFRPTQGEVLVDGIDMRQIDPNNLRRNIGFVPQDIKLFHGTLRENLSILGGVADDKEIYDSLAFGGLSELVQHHPEGLDFKIFDGGAGLSSGQRQSIGLAKLYLQDPSIVLLDEPTAALDQALENSFVNRLGSWLENRTCIVATHRPLILSQMDRIVVLHHGKVMLDGPREEVLNQLIKNSKSRTHEGAKDG